MSSSIGVKSCQTFVVVMGSFDLTLNVNMYECMDVWMYESVY